MIDIQLLLIAGFVTLIFNTIQSYYSAKNKKQDTDEATTERAASLIVFMVYCAVFYALIDYFF